MVETIDAGAHRYVGAAFTAVDSTAIRVHRERCAKVRNRNVDCLKCAAACTSGCISLEDGELVIDAAKCVGCGTCATVCPTCALESLNPSDAELKAACLRAAASLASNSATPSNFAIPSVGGDLGRPSSTEGGSGAGEGRLKSPPTGSTREVVIACSQMEAALGDLLVPGAAASVVCAGRVDESLLAGLAADGVGRVTVLCGDCGQCAQRHGRDTAELVAETARQVLGAWGNDLEVVVTDVPPVSVLASGADEAAGEVARAAYFAQERACAPIHKSEEMLAGSSVGADFSPPCAPNLDGLSQSAGDVATESGLKSAPTQNGPGKVTAHPGRSFHVMKDGTLPHFIPDRRERLLDALAQLGEPAGGKLATRLWGAVVIDGTKCVSCRMCATFCPTGAIAKFDDADGTLGVTHTPGDCVKCGSCRDVCPADAITLLDAVPASWLTGGNRHRYTMTPRPVSLIDNPHQILDTFRLDFNGDIFER